MKKGEGVYACASWGFARRVRGTMGAACTKPAEFGYCEAGWNASAPAGKLYSTHISMIFYSVPVFPSVLLQHLALTL